MTTETLKPCPFCGGEAELHWHSSDCWGTTCKVCRADGPIPKRDTEAEAIAAWNTRADADRIEELTDENEQLRDVAMDAHDALISARAFILKKHGTKNPHRDETIEKLRTLLGDPPNDLAALEKQP